MPWLDSPKIDPHLREWILANPDGRVGVVAWLTLPEPVGRRQELTQAEQEGHLIAYEAYVRKLNARHQGADISQEELDADLQRLVELAQPLKEKKEAFQLAWQEHRSDLPGRLRKRGCEGCARSQGWRSGVRELTIRLSWV